MLVEDFRWNLCKVCKVCKFGERRREELVTNANGKMEGIFEAQEVNKLSVT